MSKAFLLFNNYNNLAAEIEEFQLFFYYLFAQKHSERFANSERLYCWNGFQSKWQPICL